jgi:hypothetical protein
VPWGARVAILISIAVNLYGIWTIWSLSFVDI